MGLTTKRCRSVSLGNCKAASDFASASSCAVSCGSTISAAASDCVSADADAANANAKAKRRIKVARRYFGAVRMVELKQASPVPFGLRLRAVARNRRLGGGQRQVLAAGGRCDGRIACSGPPSLRPATRLRRRSHRLLRLAHLLLLLTQQESFACLKTFLASMSKRCCCTGNASAYWRRISPTRIRPTTR